MSSCHVLNVRLTKNCILIVSAPPSFVCPQDYKAYEESCYKFVKTPKTFYDARKTCNDDKARLISVNSQFDQGEILKKCF